MPNGARKYFIDRLQKGAHTAKYFPSRIRSVQESLQPCIKIGSVRAVAILDARLIIVTNEISGNQGIHDPVGRPIVSIRQRDDVGDRQLGTMQVASKKEATLISPRLTFHPF